MVGLGVIPVFSRRNLNEGIFENLGGNVVEGQFESGAHPCERRCLGWEGHDSERRRHLGGQVGNAFSMQFAESHPIGVVLLKENVARTTKTRDVELATVSLIAAQVVHGASEELSLEVDIQLSPRQLQHYRPRMNHYGGMSLECPMR